MSENEITFACFHCYYCDLETDANGVIPRFEEGNGFECIDEAACKRRQKRNAILADMQEMAKKPHVHPVDKFTRTAVLLCGMFLGAVSAIGISYLLFGV
jgi:hypothetical protein